MCFLAALNGAAAVSVCLSREVHSLRVGFKYTGTTVCRGGSRISEKGGLLNNIRGRVREGYSSRPARGSGGVSSPSGVWAAANAFFYIMRKTLHKIYQITITSARSMYYNRQIRMLETVFWDGPARMPCKFHQQVLFLNSARKSNPDQKSVLLS